MYCPQHAPQSHRDAWAKSQSQNRDVKVYIGAAASESAAESGYVNGSVLEEVATQTQRAFTSFGGVMFWDMSQAYGTNISLPMCNANALVSKRRLPRRSQDGPE